MAWREEGIAPDRLVAETPEPIEMQHLAPDDAVAQSRRFTRPLCPYPALAQYRGAGDQNDEASFDCAAP